MIIIIVTAVETSNLTLSGMFVHLPLLELDLYAEGTWSVKMNTGIVPSLPAPSFPFHYLLCQISVFTTQYFITYSTIFHLKLQNSAIDTAV
jgi:hypothetical protein